MFDIVRPCCTGSQRFSLIGLKIDGDSNRRDFESNLIELICLVVFHILNTFHVYN